MSEASGALLVRPMEPRDLDEVMQIEQLCFAIPWSRESMESEIRNTVARYMVVEEDGHVRGYAGTWIIIDEGHITNVAVHPDYRKHGYGHAVFGGMIRAAVDVGVKVMTLEVRVSNEAALALYRSFGFKKATIRHKYYEDNGEDAYLMVNDRLELGLKKAEGKLAL